MVKIGRGIRDWLQSHPDIAMHSMVTKTNMADFIKCISITLQQCPQQHAAGESPVSPYITAGEYVRFANQVLGVSA